MIWSDADIIWLGVSDADSEGNIVTINLGTPVGDVQLMADVDIEGRTLILRGLNV